MVLVRDEEVSLWTRQGRNLARAFPELVAASQSLPEGVVVDGEVVIWTDGRLNLDALLRRSGAGSTNAARMAREQPASYVAFDVLAVAHQDARGLQLRARGELLEELAGGWSPPLHLSPATKDEDEARSWFEDLIPSGIEGLVAKGLSTPYRGGERLWVKVKHRTTRDVVCAAVIGPRERPQELVVGLPVERALRIVGRSAPLAAATSRAVGRLLQEPQGEHPWPERVKPGAMDRFSRNRDEVVLTLVEPMVIEISADVATTGYSFRQRCGTSGSGPTSRLPRWEAPRSKATR